MKSILMSIRLYYFYCTYKGIKTVEIRKRFPSNYKGKIYEYVSKTNWKQDLMKIPAEEREFFKQFVGKVGLCFECDKVEDYVNGCKWSWKKGAPMWGIDAGHEMILKPSCLTDDELYDYCEDLAFSAIYITKLEIFDKPKELNEFATTKQQLVYIGQIQPIFQNIPLTKAPQSRQYIEVKEWKDSLVLL